MIIPFMKKFHLYKAKGIYNVWRKDLSSFTEGTHFLIENSRMF